MKIDWENWLTDDELEGKQIILLPHISIWWDDETVQLCFGWICWHWTIWFGEY